MAERVALLMDREALRAEIATAVEAKRDPRGQLVALSMGWGPLTGSTLCRWAREGRLRASSVSGGATLPGSAT